MSGTFHAVQHNMSHAPLHDADHLQRYKAALLNESHTQLLRLSQQFHHKLHTKYLAFHAYTVLPSPYASQHQNLMTFIYFGLSGLDLLGVPVQDTEHASKLIDWIYSMQVDSQKYSIGGFRGSSLMPAHMGNLAMTYTALCCLRILGDDLSRVNRDGIFALLADAQHEDGAFQPTACSYGVSETDVRFVYCACAICALLDGHWDVPGVQWDKTRKYLAECRCYDGAFGHTPQAESHGGSTYCIVSSLFLMGRLNEIDNVDDLKHWLLSRQKSGFQGRPNKPADTCYSFWIGSTLRLLDALHMVDARLCAQFTMNCQDTDRGGFGKHMDAQSDILHSYMSICGLSLLQFPGIQEVHPALGISIRAAQRVRNMPEMTHARGSIFSDLAEEVTTPPCET